MHPRPLVGFSPACPTGIESQAEYLEVECFGCPEPRALAESIKPFLPDGISILDVEDVDWKQPVFNELLRATTYRVRPPAERDESWLRERVLAFLEQERCVVRVLRKGKPRLLEARRLVLDAAAVAGALQLTIAFGHEGTIKIGEAVAAVLGPDEARRCRILKESVSLGDSQRPLGSREEPFGPYLDLVTISSRERAAAGPVQKTDRAGRVVPYAE
jgi:radical SAM-linked protein